MLVMARAARKKSDVGIYHVMLRGADQRVLFIDDEDCNRFLETLRRVKEGADFRLYACCLMGNHVHILMREGKVPLEQVFKRIGISYLYYYNWKYQLHGHLFQDRYRSESVNDDTYFLDVLRYICQNPVKAGLCRNITEYPWLRCSGIHNDTLVDSLTELTDLSGEALLNFVSESCTAEHLDETTARRLTDSEAIDLLCSICSCRFVQEIGGWEADRQKEAIKKASEHGISIRQLSRLTGISKAIIERYLRQ